MDLTEFINQSRFRQRVRNSTKRLPYVKERIRERCASMPSSEMLTRLRNYGVPCAPVNDYAAVLREEQLSVPRKLVDLHVGSRMLATPGFPIRAASLTLTSARGAGSWRTFDGDRAVLGIRH